MSSVVPSPAPLQVSDEFNAFVQLGSAVSGRGGRKAFSLLFGGQLSDRCLGIVASSKFCTKECEAGRGSCGVLSHGTKKFSPLKDTFYVKEIDGRCYMHPTFEAQDISLEGISKIQELKLTLKEFTAWFDDFKEGRLEGEWKKPASPPLVIKTTMSADELDIDSLVLETPKISTADLGIFMSPPKLSFDSEDDGPKDESDLMVEDKTTLLATICMERFANLKHKWTQTFLEVEASYSSVVKDLQHLHTYVSGCKHLRGYPDATDAGDSTTLWSKICQLGEMLQLQTSDVEQISSTTTERLRDIQHQQDSLRQECCHY
jgi:hypothetical protein